ncbi:AcrR family transcriptional regulator [Hamadaea flava]|uniref:TetR family transcriptional regulator n=1 Tax=Hamadaea flava TaxID=1742688 RepID=A0ABV8LM32_9ACTN|nr:TetR family transcriptional regulator [Hamadaea flava]MCP2323788.1 AcrR family transcriptional regulator [Hamadaea flava]
MQGEGTEVNGRKQRWAAHREQRRVELIQAAIAAVLEHGPEVDMEQVAATAGVSKPVLYRYFADKSQLWIAVGQHLAGVVVNAVAPAVEQVREERTLIEATIDAYLGVIEAEPNLYRFVMHQSGIPGVHQLIVGASREVAVELARVIGDRLRALGLDAGPAEPWAYGLVGFVQSVGDWWMQHGRPIRREALTDYLTELLWSGFDGLRRRADLPLEIRTMR